MIVKGICTLLDLPFIDHRSNRLRLKRRPGKNAKYGKQDIFILASSVRPQFNKTVAMIENLLSYNWIACFIPSDDFNEPDERVTANKVVFSSFHRAKGRQRKIVFVLGFDQTYFRLEQNQELWYRCPNNLYVACTRAS